MNYANSKMAWLISEFVHSERDRQILSRRFLDGISQDAVANENKMSKRHIQNIEKRLKAVIVALCEAAIRVTAASRSTL